MHGVSFYIRNYPNSIETPCMASLHLSEYHIAKKMQFYSLISLHHLRLPHPFIGGYFHNVNS
jgi:hypothetical protein